MNASDRNLEIIKKAEGLTSSGKLVWQRLRGFVLSNPQNKGLKMTLVSENNYSPYSNTPNIDELHSFCAKFESGVIIVFGRTTKKNGHSYTMALQANEDGKVLEITSKDEFQVQLKKLAYHIEQSLDNFDVFIDNLINYES